MILFFDVSRIIKFIGTESRTVVIGLGGSENLDLLFNMYRESVWDYEKVLEMDMMMVTQ